MIPVVIWTWGLGGLRPAPFFAEICGRSEERKTDESERHGGDGPSFRGASVLTCML